MAGCISHMPTPQYKTFSANVKAISNPYCKTQTKHTCEVTSPHGMHASEALKRQGELANIQYALQDENQGFSKF